MKLLNHPNVIRLYEVIDSEIFLFLVMEYAAGGEVCVPVIFNIKHRYMVMRNIFIRVGSSNELLSLPGALTGSANKLSTCTF